MHRRPGVGLGDDQRVGLVRAGLVAERGQLAGPDRVFAFPQHAQAAALDDPQLVRLAAAHDLVVAGAEQDEMVVVEPAQQCAGLIDVRSLAAWHPLVEPLDGVLDPRQHRLPVLDGRTDVLHRVAQPSLDSLQRLGFVLPVDLDVHDRLGPALGGRLRPNVPQPALRVAVDHHHRVDDAVNAEPELRGHQHRGIHQERHIVVVHLDDGVVRGPAVILDGRVEDP